MEKINQFSVHRFMLLIKRYAIFNTKTLLIGLGALSGVMIFIALIQTYVSGGMFNVEALTNTGQTMIFIGGFVLTSMVFKELHAPARSQFYLTLPATTAEKLFSSWIITSVGFVVLANVILSLVLLLSNGLAHIAWSTPISYFNPFTSGNIQIMSVYFVTQSIFFLGAIYFRKNNFLKTILSLFVISFVINIITAGFMYIIFGQMGMGGEMQSLPPDFILTMESTAPKLARFAFYGIITPLSLLVSYFRLKEREV